MAWAIAIDGDLAHVTRETTAHKNQLADAHTRLCRDRFPNSESERAIAAERSAVEIIENMLLVARRELGGGAAFMHYIAHAEGDRAINGFSFEVVKSTPNEPRSTP